MAKVTISRETIEDFTKLLSAFTEKSVRDVLFDRMEYIDRCIQREANRSSEHVKARQQHRAGNKQIISDVEIPTVLAHVGTAHARLVGTFLSGTPIFGCTTQNPDLADVALMLSTLSHRDEKRFKWVPQLSLCLSDALRYLFCAAEVEYATIQRASIAVNAGEGELKSIAYRGNNIRRVDPYNVFFDTTVPLHEVSSRGAYAGYVERLNYINTKLYLGELDQSFARIENFSKALGAVAPNSLYRRPDCTMPLEQKTSTDWTAFWGTGSKNASAGNHDGVYEKVVLYVKLVPSEYKIRMARDGTPTIFKICFINGVVVYAEPMQAAHGQIPIVIGMGNDDGLGLQAKSQAEQLVDFQELLSGLINGVFKSMRRAVADRALYDPLRIKAADVNSANPAAKIPVKLNQLNKDLGSAYYAIPYRDEVGPNFVANFGLLKQIAQEVTGLNPAAQGAFVKGNRTQTEYMDVQSNSDARSLNFALNLENTFFGQIKYICKMNYLQYATDDEIIPKDSEQPVKIDPTKLRQRDLDFDMTDGVVPASKTINSEMLTAAMNGIAQMPMLDVRYSRARMFVHILKSQGLNLEQFKASPEEQQAAMRMQAAVNPQQQQGGQ